MKPLTRSPLGPPPPSAASDAAPIQRTGALARLAQEARSALALTEPGRLLWDATRSLPDFAFPGVRAQMLRAIGCDVRRSVGIMGHISIVGPRGCASKLRIGPGSIIGPGATFCLDAEIVLGRNVSIGPRAMLYTATHALGTSSQRMRPEVLARPITIGDGAWIALGAIILPGVRIGRGAVIAAGSVVSEDVPDDALVAGNPAAVVEQLP